MDKWTQSIQIYIYISWGPVALSKVYDRFTKEVQPRRVHEPLYNNATQYTVEVSLSKALLAALGQDIIDQVIREERPSHKICIPANTSRNVLLLFFLLSPPLYSSSLRQTPFSCDQLSFDHERMPISTFSPKNHFTYLLPREQFYSTLTNHSRKGMGWHLRCLLRLCCQVLHV